MVAPVLVRSRDRVATTAAVLRILAAMTSPKFVTRNDGSFSKWCASLLTAGHVDVDAVVPALCQYINAVPLEAALVCWDAVLKATAPSLPRIVQGAQVSLVQFIVEVR